jgi:hypothetical protein
LELGKYLFGIPCREFKFSPEFSSFLAASDAVWMFERCHVLQNSDTHHPVPHCITYAVLIPH